MEKELRIFVGEWCRTHKEFIPKEKVDTSHNDKECEKTSLYDIRNVPYP